MKVIVFSHKECWKSDQSPTGWATDGGFAMHMDYLSTLFDSMTIWVPEVKPRPTGEVFFSSEKIQMVPIHVNFGTGLKRKLRVLLWAAKNSFRIIRAFRKHDAVHAPIPSDIGTIGIWFALLLRKPLYIRYCGNILDLNTMAEKYWGRLLNRIAGGKNVVLATGGGQEFPVPQNPKVKWIFSSSLTERVLKEYAMTRTQASMSERPLKIGYLGRIEKGKGIEILLRSLPLLQEKMANRQLMIEVAGEGSYRVELEKEFQSNHIRFRGKLNREEVKLYLQELDLFVFPSFSEGFPKAVLEALASGLPVVCSGVSVLPDLVEGSGSGIILKELHPDQIVDAVMKILNTTGLYDQMSLNAMKEARKYSLESWAMEIDKELKQAWLWK